MKIKFSGFLSKANIVSDLVLFNLAFVFSYFLKFDEVAPILSGGYLNLLLIGNLLWIVIIYFQHIYDFSRIVHADKKRPILSFFRAVVLHMAIGSVLMYLSKNGELFSREFFLIAYTAFLIGGVFVRLMITFSLNYLRSSGYNIRRYGMIGKGLESGMIKSFYRERRELGYQFCGAMEMQGNSLAELENFIVSERLDYLYCTLSDLTETQVQNVLYLAERHKTKVKLIPDFKGFMDRRVSVEYHGLCPVITVNDKPLGSSRERIAKRAFDLVFSGLVMIAGFPVFILVMLLVRISSPGPVFFLQERSGQWGRIFRIYKFRTMYVDADKFGMQHSTGDDDPRITPIGRILRKTRLDELPQFFNVLKGDMSVVGPRPLNHYDVDMLMKAASHDFRKVLTVPPGITSIGQIKVGYATNIKENLLRLNYDMEYLKRYSLITDVRLILMTVQVMILGRGK